MQKFNFDLTLNLPKDTQGVLRQNIEEFSIQSSNFKFNLKLSKQNIQLLLFLTLKIKTANNKSKFYFIPKSISFSKESVELSDLQQINQYTPECIIVNIGQQNIEKGNVFYTFQPSIILKQAMLKLQINQSNIKFIMRPVKKAKFIKNQKLIQAISSKTQTNGFLSMDQMARVMIQGINSTFPIIGIWQKNSYPINNLQTYSKMTLFLTSNNYTKCRFYHLNQSYFYYAKFESEQQTLPQLYLVTWSVNPEIKYLYEYELSKLIAKTSQKIDLPYFSQSLQQDPNEMQFTLRNKSEQKLLKSIDFCSPIKQFSSKDLEQQLLNFQGKDSPKFHKTQNPDLQTISREALIAVINEQSDQIKNLKQEIQRLKSELKALSTKTGDSTGNKNYRLLRSPYYQVNLSTAKLKPKLAESDLIGSFGSSNKNINNIETLDQSSIRAGCQKYNPEIIKNLRDYEEPWQQVQFID